MERLLQDVRYAMRGLRRAPGFALVAILTLALGIGVNSAIFSVVNAILYRPLPVERPDELVDIYGHSATSSTHDTHSYPNYVSYREQTTTLSGLIGYSNFFAHFSIQGSSDLLVGEIVSDNYFTVLGVRPMLGRAFLHEEYSAPGASPVAVLSYRLWQTRFAGAPDVLGKTLKLNGIVYTVVGVAPKDFGGMMPAVTAQMWIPATMADHVEPMGNQRSTGHSTGSSRLEQRGRAWMWMKGRMKPGVTVQQVRAEFDGMTRRLAQEFPATNADERIFVVPTRDVRINPDFDDKVAPAGLVLLGAVALVLIVACANLANLLLARAAGRRREIAVRIAIGASRGRLMRQLLTESVLIAIAGGAVAIPLAIVLVRLIARAQPPLPLDLGLQITPDWRVLLFTLLVAVATGIIFGLVPALRASRPDLVPALKDGAGDGGRRRRWTLRDGLVVVQMAVSLMLVVGGALMVRSLAAAARVHLGYDSDRLGFVALALDMNGYDADRAAQFFTMGRERLAALPQVQAVSLTNRLPMSLNNNGFGIFIDGRQTSAADKPFYLDGAYVDENYFDVLRVKLLAGRGIEPADRDQRRRVAVISAAMAQRFWPGRPSDALGREFRVEWGGEPYHVIGVSADYKVDTPGEQPKPYIHLPISRREIYGNFVVRTAVPARRVIPALQTALREMDPELVFMDKGTLRDYANIRLFAVRAGAWLIGAFGFLALAVAGVGLYGVIGYAVSRRVREIGIRQALGARPVQLFGMIVREGMALAVIGGVLGAALAALAARALSSVLYVGAFDVASFAIAFLVLGSVALVANAIPARRAARVDPMVAIREG
jgi:predicted permease